MRDIKGVQTLKTPTSKFLDLLRSDPTIHSVELDDSPRTSTHSNGSTASSDMSVGSCSPLNPASPFFKSPWTTTNDDHHHEQSSSTGLIATLTREQGHLYSLAVSDNLLYTGSDSKNIRVWKSQSEFSAFKSGSGLVKAIIVSDNNSTIFTGHQDGKIRVWRREYDKSSTDHSPVVLHKRVGTLPTLKEVLKTSVNPSNYVKVRRHRRAVWVRHFDAVSCLSIDEEAGLLYSGSWDKTIKVWRVEDSKCLESINAHDDAINSVAVAFDGMVVSGSADGTVKVWRYEREREEYVLVTTLLRQESAVTAVAAARDDGVIYCGSSDGMIKYWERDLVKGGGMRGSKMAVLCLATAGSLVVSGAADGTVRVWRREMGGDHMKIAELAGHVGPVKCLAVEECRAQGKRWVVYSGSLDKTVKVWRVDERVKEAHVMRTQQHVWWDLQPKF